jgi:alkanesulfonate monooxygenase SsuD/methylene tetrahydromethanopterin reductase-like flavin-dependent oxidoreductase (luciferase family)
MRSTAQRPAATPNLYAVLQADARHAEALGFHSLWLAEHHFWYDGWCPAPVVAAAAVLGATARLVAGTGVQLLSLWERPSAQAAAETLAALSGGRLELGVGLGYRAEEFAGFGVDRSTRGRRMDDALDLLGPEWGGREDAPRLLVGGFSEAALSRAGSRGLGILLPYSLERRELTRAIARYREACGAAGEVPGRIGVMRQAWPTEGGAGEARAARTAIAASIGEYASAWFSLRGRTGFDAPELFAEQLRRATETALVGPPESIAAEIAELEALGADLVILQVTRDDIVVDHQAAMERIAEGLRAGGRV